MYIKLNKKYIIYIEFHIIILLAIKYKTYVIIINTISTNLIMEIYYYTQIFIDF